MKRVNIQVRVPLAKLSAAVEAIKEKKFDREIAQQFAVGQTTVNQIRRLLVDSPALLDRALAGEISIGEARRLQKAGSQSPVPDPVPVPLDKLRADLLAWVALTRELLDSIERLLTSPSE